MSAAEPTPAQAAQPRVWVVLPVHNNWASTEGFLACLAKQDYRPLTLVLVDDGSTDGTAEHVRRAEHEAVVLTGSGNLWWAGALDKACRYLMRHARDTDVALIMNNDTTFEPGFVARGVAVMGEAPGTLVHAESRGMRTGAAMDPARRIDWRALRFLPAGPGEDVEVLSTRALFLRVGDWRRIGGMHPTLLPHYLSDYEFTYRAHRRGFRLVRDGRLQVRVNEETTAKRGGAPAGALRFVYDAVFNRRNVMNVAHWTAFILLACPPRYRVQSLARWWLRFARHVGIRLFGRARVEGTPS